MKCKFCSKETLNEYEVCEDCEKTLTLAINKNRRRIVKNKIANQNRGITSLVCAVMSLTRPFGFLVSFICGIVAIVFAAAAKNTAGAQFGKIGKTLGIVGLVSIVIRWFINVILFAGLMVLIAFAIVFFSKPM